MKKTIFKYFAIAALATLTLSGCNDLDQYPSDQFTDDSFWVSAERAQLVLNTGYNQMYTAGNMWRDEKLSDNMVIGRSTDDLRTIRNGQATASLNTFSDSWADFYRGMKTCNTFMDKIDLVPNMDPNLKARMIAEMRVLRAWQYFKLTNYYGDVPFFTSDITLEQARTISRTNIATIRKFIHDEYEASIDALPTNKSLAKAETGRLTKGAVIAMNIRLYLYEGNYEKVVEWCENLMNGNQYGTYSLNPTYQGIFDINNEGNAEVIMDVQYVDRTIRNWSDMNYLLPRSVGAPLNSAAPTQSLVDNYLMLSGNTIDVQGSGSDYYDENNPYANRDPRLTATVVYHGYRWDASTTINIKPGSNGSTDSKVDEYSTSDSNGTPTGYFVRKWYDPTTSNLYSFASGLNIIFFRYAEILMNYAEAKYELGEMDASVWDATIRKIRERAGFTASKALDYSQQSGDMQKIIRNERRSEFALEGLRYYDIMRWKAGKEYLVGTVLGAKFADNNTSYIRLDYRMFNEQRDYLWAVPEAQVVLNPNLAPNNKGY